jgi:hypothetical protein
LFKADVRLASEVLADAFCSIGISYACSLKEYDQIHTPGI